MNGLVGNSVLVKSLQCPNYNKQTLYAFLLFMHAAENRVKIEQEGEGCFCLETPDGSKVCDPPACYSKRDHMQLWSLYGTYNILIHCLDKYVKVAKECQISRWMVVLVVSIKCNTSTS